MFKQISLLAAAENVGVLAYTPLPMTNTFSSRQSRVAGDTNRGKTPQQIFGGQTQRLPDLEGKLLCKLLMLLSLGFQMPLAALAKTPLQSNRNL